MLTLKSNISANIYGPAWVIARLGFIMSDKITESSPYLLRNNLVHSIPNWPKPPEWNYNFHYNFEAKIYCAFFFRTKMTTPIFLIGKGKLVSSKRSSFRFIKIKYYRWLKFLVFHYFENNLNCIDIELMIQLDLK